MRSRWMVLALLLFVAAGGGAHRVAQAKGSPAGTQLVSGLRNPINARLGPDGMIYVAEGGTGGTTDFTGADGTVYHNGLTGRISKIDPSTGTRTTVIDGLPSNGGDEGAAGPTDVAFLNGQLYYLHTHGGAGYGFPGHPTGIYKVSGGAAALVADIGAFNLADPVDDIKNHVQPDVEVGGNPFAMITRGGTFLVTDGNQNQVMQITQAGAITRLMQFHNHPVTTGITYQGSGPLYVTTLGKFPFSNDDGILWRVTYPGGAATQIAHGAGSLTGTAYGPNGQLYVLTIGTQAADPSGPAPWDFGSGRILRVEADGTLTPIVDGLMLPTSLVFDGNTAYVVGLLGDITKIDGFSSLQPIPPTATPAAAPTTAPSQPTPAATATPSGVIAGPNTGSGPDGSDGNGLLWALAIIAGIAGVACTGIAVRTAKG